MFLQDLPYYERTAVPKKVYPFLIYLTLYKSRRPVKVGKAVKSNRNVAL